MEQFKNLNWSWKKYEKKEDPREFSFETIADRDPLSRTINEVHLAVLPKPHEYRYLKTPEEIVANTFDDRGLLVDVKDPRKNVTKFLKTARDQVKDYGYASVLTVNSQNLIITSLKLDSDYNPKLTKNVEFFQNKPATTISPEIKQKWIKEIEHFNKSAEIYFYRHIADFNNLLKSDMKNYLCKRWNSLECDLSEQKYQIITMLLRQKTWETSATMSVEFQQDFSLEFDKNAFTMPPQFFPSIQQYSIEQLKLYDQHLHNSLDDSIESDLKISLEVLTKLFVDENEFSIGFENSEIGTKFFSNVVPPKLVNQKEVLEDVVRKILIVNVEWLKINQNSNEFKEIPNNFEAKKIDEVMSKIYTQFKKNAGQNTSSSLYKLSKNESHLNIHITNDIIYQNPQTTINISIKIEFQTKFGAEKMTKEELLREWIQQKFTNNSITLRYRVDAITLEILSITQITLEQIEIELSENCNFDPRESLEVLYNTLNSIKHLPHGSYMIQARNDNKLYIYKANDNGKIIITADDIKINSSFTRKWIPIEEKFPTYITFNLKIAPCCFPVVFGIKKRTMSYTQPRKIHKTLSNNKKKIQKVVQNKKKKIRRNKSVKK